MTITNEQASKIVADMKAELDRRDELTGGHAVDSRDLLLIKLWDDLQALTNATAFLGGGIKPVQRVG